MNATLGKCLYGFLFCLMLPALLIGWAKALALALPSLPPVGSGVFGWPLIIGGAGLLLGGMANLWTRGGGLPMNAYPPPRFVASGLYRWISHPIYLGFSLLIPGIFIVARLPAGLWVVAPVCWLGTSALVIGHERLDLQRRFGDRLEPPRLGLPPAASAPPCWWHRAAAYVLVFVPWSVAQLGIDRLLGHQPGWLTYFPVERSWPMLPGALPFIALAWLWVLLAPLGAGSQLSLRRFVRDGWAGWAILLWLQLVLPLSAAPRVSVVPAFPESSLASALLTIASSGSFPSPHVFWVFLAARLWADRLPVRAAHGLAAVLAMAAVGSGGSSIVGVAAGFIVFLTVDRLDELWRGLLHASETVANSWHDWRLGAVRIINHGIYVAVAAGAGLWLVGFLLGERLTAAILLVGGCSLLGAGIWAQLLESSSGLSRPFGYYGGIFGGWLGILIAHWWRDDGWLLMGAFATVSPLVQATGRLRCLVQGCCHGRPCPDHLGIRYQHPLSRVCKMTSWKGAPVHPTPLYSIIGNIVILGLLLRLWLAEVSLGLVVGAALILTACARFMEEGYRGEPQTVRWGGLAIYQWLALLFVLGGQVCSILPTPPVPTVAGTGILPLLYAIPFGLLVGFAMGVDFPESNRRFSRLA